MELSVRTPTYSRVHGEVRNFGEYQTKFPAGVVICNGRQFGTSYEDFKKFKNHINRGGMRCKCPRFTMADRGMVPLEQEIEKLRKEVRDYKIVATKSDEDRIRVDRERVNTIVRFKMVGERILGMMGDNNAVTLSRETVKSLFEDC